MSLSRSFNYTLDVPSGITTGSIKADDITTGTIKITGLSSFANVTSTNETTGILIATTGITTGTIKATSLSSLANVTSINQTTGILIATTGITSGSVFANSSYVTSYNGINGAISPLNGSFLTIEAFTTGNTAKLPVLINPYGGYVGIGTTSPQLSFHLRHSGGNVMKVENISAVNNACIEFTNDNSTSYIGLGGSSVGNILANRLFFQSPKDINFTVNGGSSNAMFMNTSGNIGINTTSPISKLSINDQVIDRSSFDHSGAPITITHPTVTGSTLNDRLPVMHLTRQGQAGVAFGARATFALSRYESNGTDSRTQLDLQLSHVNYDTVNVMSIRSNGYIGIGRSSPAYTLDVNGAIRVGAQINVDWGSVHQKLIDVTWTGFYDQVRFYTPGNLTGDPKMYLQPNGLGIGVQPSNTLHIGGEGAQYPTSLKIDETGHATSNRATMVLGNWLLTQDIAGDGVRNFGIYDGNTSAWRMSISTSGNIGVGTNTPSYPLHVSGAVSSSEATWVYQLAYTSSVNYVGYVPDQGSVYSIRASNRILAERVDVNSDARIKKNIVDVNDISALNVIRQIEPKRYNYVDEIKKGKTPVWGFIAQQIEGVLDYAVSKTTDFIPDIYDVAIVTSSTVGTVLSLTKATSVLNTNLDNTITIQLYSCNQSYQVTLKEIVDDHTFIVNESIVLEEIDGGKVFVYGQKVDDFHNLNKEAIFTVAVAALQEVDRELQDTKAELESTKTELSDLKAFIQSKFPGEL